MKFQITNPKYQINPKSQISNPKRFGHRNFGNWSLFDAWCLKFGAFLICFLVLVLVAPRGANAGTIIKAPAYLGLSRGLVGYWNFDGTNISGTRAKDSSGNNNHGTLTSANGLPTKTAGRIGQALSFDGVDDYVTMGDIDALDGLTTLTVSGWFNFSTITSEFIHLVDKRNGNDGWDIQMGGTADGTNDEVMMLLGTGATLVSGKTNNNAITSGAWYNIAVVYNGAGATDSDKLKIYINGLSAPLTFVGTIPATLTAVAANLVIARPESDLSDSWFGGRSDDIHIYNRALSDAEILRIYRIGLGSTANRSSTSLNRGLIGCWNFDGAFTKIPDCSGNQNKGVGSGSCFHDIGKVGQSINFLNDFNCNINVGTPAKLNNIKPVTISAWVYRNRLMRADDDYIISKWTGEGNGMFFRYCCNSNAGLEFHVEGANTDLNKTASDSSFGQWVQVVATWDGTVNSSGVHLYKNGSEMAYDSGRSSDADSLGSDADAALLLASDIGQIGTDGFNGRIDEVKIYNRVLSAGEIKRLYDQTQSKFNSSQTDILTKGLVGYWNFDGPNISGTRVKDLSGNNNHGTLTGANGLPVMTAGKIGQALDFDGVDDYVSLGSLAPAILQPNHITLSAWMRVKGNAGGIDSTNSGTAITFAKDGTGGSFYGYGLRENSAQINNKTYGFQIDTTDLTATEISATLARSYIDEWHNVVGTYDGTTQKIYVDGVFYNSSAVESGNINYSHATINSPISIGGWNNNDNFINGDLDDVRIYNRALSASEVNKLYQMGR